MSTNNFIDEPIDLPGVKARLRVASLVFSPKNAQVLFPVYIYADEQSEYYLSITYYLTIDGEFFLHSWNGYRSKDMEDAVEDLLVRRKLREAIPRFIEQEYKVGRLAVAKEALDRKFNREDSS